MDLKSSIAEKASGVLLWVYVVVNTLLSGLVNGDRLERLRDTLDTLPPELENLFDKIIQQLDPKYAQEASELFQFVRAHPADSTLIGLYWSQLSLEDVLRAAIARMSIVDAEYRAKLMQRNVISRCKCLLDAGSAPDPTGPVTWIHRTVREWLEQPSVWNRILDLSPRYDTDVALCLSRFRQAKASVTSHGYKADVTERALLDAFLKAEVLKSVHDRLRLVQEIEKTGIELLRPSASMARNQHQVYWLDTESLYEKTKPDVLEGLTTAFHAAMALGWGWLVRDRVESDSGILDIPVSTECSFDALMLASVNSWHDMEEICLKAGANPQKNFPFASTSYRNNAWQQALEFGVIPLWLCAEYLRCGASAHLASAQSVLECLLRDISGRDNPEDIRIIQESVRKHKDRSDRRWKPYPRRR